MNKYVYIGLIMVLLLVPSSMADADDSAPIIENKGHFQVDTQYYIKKVNITDPNSGVWIVEMSDPKNVDNKRLIITIPNTDSYEEDVKSLRDGDIKVSKRWKWQAKPKIVTLKVPYENPHQPINFTIWARNGATEGKWGERFIENDPAIEKKGKMSDPGCFSCHGSIGGTQTPIDKKSLLFPYIIGISLVMISIIYVLMYKKRKEKIQVKKN